MANYTTILTIYDTGVHTNQIIDILNSYSSQYVILGNTYFLTTNSAGDAQAIGQKLAATLSKFTFMRIAINTGSQVQGMGIDSSILDKINNVILNSGAI